jgi:drug/metabolite transporter (DMT)-like permease
LKAKQSPSSSQLNTRGLSAALLTPTFLGLAPLFGKLAYMGGSDPFTVAATRTVVAAGILWIAYLLFWRQFIYIYPAGLLGCVVVGMTNGIGSLFYYNGLRYLDASVAQLLNASYLIIVVLLQRFAGQPLSRRALIRVLLAFIAIMILTGGVSGRISWLGAGLMIGNAILFAGTVIMSQRVLYEMPSPTVTLYTLTAMAVVVVMARVVYRLEWIPQTSEAIGAIFVLGITTALSRLTLFIGVKHLGTLQTALLGVFETAVTLLTAFLFLHEQLTPVQWIGVTLLFASLLFVQRSDLKKRETGEVPIVNMAGIGFHREAFSKAFGAAGEDLTPEELEMIKRMMEGSNSPPDQPPQAAK